MKGDRIRQVEADVIDILDQLLNDGVSPETIQLCVNGVYLKEILVVLYEFIERDEPSLEHPELGHISKPYGKV